MIAASDIYVSAFQGHLRNKLMHDVPGTASEGRSNGEILRVLRLAKSLQGWAVHKDDHSAARLSNAPILAKRRLSLQINGPSQRCSRHSPCFADLPT